MRQSTPVPDELKPSTTSSANPITSQQGNGPTMDFPEAVRQATIGHRVTKLEWNNPDAYMVRADGYLCIHEAGEPVGTLHALMVNDGDLLGMDWITLP